MSSFNFRMGGCAWCHPGGGALEYDRQGYRYDGKDGATAYKMGANPNAATQYGDYYVFDSSKPLNTQPFLVSKVGAAGKGVAEVDCLMCHLSGSYNNQARDYCATSPGDAAGFAPNKGATMALTRTGVVTTTNPGNVAGVNSSCDYTYADAGAGVGTLPKEMIATTPKKEACALCHFPDAAKPNGTGPAGSPLDWTTFQKYYAPGAFTDSDTGEASLNTYNLTKGRAEAGKRAESINDAGNPDGHLDKLVCADCHYNVSGTFAAVVDSKGNVIQDAVTVKSIDHQFAKGNNRPDGKNMDQMDNTVTCEGCHITPDQNANPRILNNGDGTFSFNSANSGVIPLPIPKHVALPTKHFVSVDCRTCHIPEENFVSKQMVTDFSTTPYPADVGFERGQNLGKKVGGVPQRLHYRPLYAWQDRGHHGNELQLAPVSLGGVFVWKDLTSGVPYAKRFPTDAVKAFRASQGGTGAPGDPFLWKLNSPQGGDEALIVNKTSEISGMVDAILNLNDDSMPSPALNIYVNQFTLSHNVAPKAKALGGPESGCSACHSADSVLFASAPVETNPDSPCYGQPQGCKGLVFKQPLDGGVGLEMTCDGAVCPGTCIDAVCSGGENNGAACTTDADCPGGTKRISNGIPFSCPDGSRVTIDLTKGVAHGSAVNNVIPQEEVLCYDDLVLAKLRQPQNSTYFAGLDAAFTWKASTAVSLKVDLDGAASKCPSTASACSYTWDCGEAGVTAADGVTSSCQYLTAGNHAATLTVTDQDAGYFDAFTQTVNAQVLTGPVAPSVDSTWDAGLHALQVTVSGSINRAVVYWGDGTSNNTYSATTLSHTYTGVAPKSYSCKVYVYDKNNVRTTYTIPASY